MGEAEGASNTVHVLFIPAAVAEGGLLVKGYLWQLFHGVNTRYSLYRVNISCFFIQIKFQLLGKILEENCCDVPRSLLKGTFLYIHVGIYLQQNLKS